MRFGVVRFPGSCDEVDALLACRRFGEAQLLWHKERDLSGVEVEYLFLDAVYESLRRYGALRREFSGCLVTNHRRAQSALAPGGGQQGEREVLG
jgi:hypothetical protein